MEVLKRFVKNNDNFSKVVVESVKEGITIKTQHSRPKYDSLDFFKSEFEEKLEMMSIEHGRIPTWVCTDILYGMFIDLSEEKTKNKFLNWTIKWEKQIHIVCTIMAIIIPSIVTIICAVI